MITKIFHKSKKAKNPAISLTLSQQRQIASNISATNWKRNRIFLAFASFFELLLILFNDIPAFKTSAPGDIWLVQAYLVLHLIIGLTALLGIILFSVFLRKNMDQKLSRDYLSPVLTLILLVCLSLITGLDQITTGNISVFVINLVVCGVVVLVPGWTSFILFTIPFGVLVAGLFAFQPDLAIRNSHLINGGIFWVAVLIFSRYMYDNHVSHLIKNMQLEEANQKLMTLSMYDSLTNLANRRNFESRIEYELALIKRFSQHSWLIMVDIDHFKNINDRFGHAAGDRVLKEVAALLQSNIRDVDLICRWGGEEFLLLITRTELDEVIKIANRLCKALAELSLDVDQQIIRVTASFGIAMLTSQGAAADDFLVSYQRADQALYQAKQNGRNQVAIVN